jgi:Ca-activated chloride channel homolog
VRSQARLRPVPLTAGVCAGLLMLAAIIFVVRPGAALASVPCGVPLTVAASPEKFDELSALADRYNSRGCWPVTVLSVSSGDALEHLTTGWNATTYPQSPQPPQVWSPAATAWVRMLQQRAVRDDVKVVNDDQGVLPSVAKTPLVLAMPQPIAERLGWPARPIGWQTLLELATDPTRWNAVSGGQWGSFKLGKTNPNYSTSGMNSLVAAYAAASGHQTVTAADVLSQEVRGKIGGIESAALHYGETTLTYLCNLAAADRVGAERVLGYVHAVPVEEKSVHEYNQGRQVGCDQQHVPAVKLAAVYPSDGTIMSDSPYAILGNATADQRRLAEHFLDFLREPEQQDTLKAAGFRGAEDEELDPRIAQDTGLAAEPALNEIEIPDPAVLEGIRASWQELRKPARVLFLVDVSGSMSWSPYSDDPPPSGQPTRMDQVKAAATQALNGFGDHDEVGLWEFSLYRSAPPYREVMAPVSMRIGRDALKEKINDLEPRGDTPLYVAIRDAQRELAATAQVSRITAIVALTDGEDTYGPSYTKEDLITDIEGTGPDHAVRVFTVAYGKDAPKEELSQIAAAGRGRGYDSTTPDNITKILRQVVSNF